MALEQLQTLVIPFWTHRYISAKAYDYEVTLTDGRGNLFHHWRNRSTASLCGGAAE